MMTPGLHALKLKFPGHDIHLAIPRKFAQLFSGNDDIELLDIESAAIDVRSYEKWFNITDCPAARIESRTMPEVTQSRIDIFSRSFGIRGRQLQAMDKRPRYFVTEAERDFQEDFWKRHGLLGKTVIGVQLQAAEPYRDYPHMADLVRTLAQDAVVLLFHAEKTAVDSRRLRHRPGTDHHQTGLCPGSWLLGHRRAGLGLCPFRRGPEHTLCGPLRTHRRQDPDHALSFLRSC